MKNRKGFTLVELLAVIVILAVILIIAIPQIMKTIKATRLKSIEDSARLIATNADKDYLAQQAINSNYNATSIPCTDVAKLSKDYASCTITYDSNGVSTVKLKGANGGKFNKIKCEGTKDEMNCTEIMPLPGYTDAVELLMSKYNDGTNSEGLKKVEHDTNTIPNATAVEYRYQGTDPNNYVYFNCEDNSNPTSSTCEVWRIIGLFDGRVKLVRKYSIGSFSWDSSDSSINSGYGISQWGESTYTDGTPYEGADLMRELNTDYLNSSLSENANWYIGLNNAIGSGNFNKKYVLKESTQKLIGEATWYLGGVPSGSTTIRLADTYAAERGTQGRACESGDGCNDTVERAYTWIGKVGLVYPSDIGYASSYFECAKNIYYDHSDCIYDWMSGYGWTISPETYSSGAWSIKDNGIGGKGAYDTWSVRPSVYLIPGVQMKGSGTTADPYVFAE